jgi:membrane-bound ClpP family serine protease
MDTFIQLEGGYLAIGLFILGVAIFVGTRPFVGNGQAWKKIVPFVLITLSGFIMAHYFVTTSRMADVKARFNSGGAVICESKAVRKVAQSVIIDPKRLQGWILIGDEFHSPHYERTFHVARCLEYFYPKEQSK